MQWNPTQALSCQLRAAGPKLGLHSPFTIFNKLSQERALCVETLAKEHSVQISTLVLDRLETLGEEAKKEPGAPAKKLPAPEGAGSTASVGQQPR